MSIEKAITIAAEHFKNQNGTGRIEKLYTSKNTILAIPEERDLDALKISRVNGSMQVVPATR